ncbi:asparagine synthase (glutamine-hydrolysing) [Candidatus Magnetomoraceae bacterium gMMP-1]
MCSIYGSIGKNYKNIEAIFSKELRHRGPDDRGIFYDYNAKLVLGHTRLSIIDLSNHAHQPMYDGKKNYILVFNGEIYNYQDIKKELEKLGHNFSTHSDTEILLKSYIEWRESCLKQFRGMFAFCIYDKQKKELFLARDRFGIKPLIYSFLDNQFIFSSELKPFLKSNIIHKKIDSVSVNNYFRYGSVKQPKTMLEGVFHLMPGHFMKVNLDMSFEISKYYDLIEESAKLNTIHNYEEAVKNTREIFEDATKYHMVADVEVGAFLSGGIDSTAVVAMMKHYSTKQINTFSLGFKHKTNVIDETDVADRTAKYLGTNHHNIKIDNDYVANIFDGFINSLDQPSIDGINTYIISLETAKKMKVALSGLGGDEIFAGYPHFQSIAKYSQRKKNLISMIGRRLNSIRPNRFTNKFEYLGLNEEVGLNYLRSINKNLDNILKIPRSSATINNYKKLSSIQKISKAEIDNYMLNTLLRDNDVLSMAHSLEVRPILLDHKLVELAFIIQDDYKVRNGRLKAVLVDATKDMIPSEVWQRSKTGFEMPFADWMNEALNNKFKNVVQSKKAKEIFQQDYLNFLNKRIKSKILKRNDWLSFVFLSWLDLYETEI